MLQAADIVIRLNPADDVVIARIDIPEGTMLLRDNVRTAVRVPPGHKIAVKDVATGAPVRRYNQIIGFATRDIKAGDHVHVHNIAMGNFERSAPTRSRPTT
jgi:altronate hydrolase